MGVLLVVGVLTLLAVLVSAWLSSTREPDLGPDEQTPTLRYVVPDGQDPAAPLAALVEHGYPATTDTDGQLRVLTISGRGADAPDRDEVRALLARAGSTIQDPAPADGVIVFEDERRV